MHKRLMDFLNKNNTLNEHQFGVRNNRSTVQVILLIADKIQRAIKDKKISCDIFLDLSKAFDTVQHDILVKELENYVNNWLRLYLSNRK